MKLRKEFHKLSPEDRLYKSHVPVIGLTGGIATGKSTVSEILKSENIPVICADELVKDIYKHPQTKKFINDHYPEAIHNDEIDFPKLRERFFTDKVSKEEIENLIYSQLPEAWARAMAKIEKPLMLVHDVPLLFEKKLEGFFDLTILVYAPREIQKGRLIERDEITPELAENILNHQMSIEDKKKKSDLIINNSGNIEALGAEVEKLLHRILY